MKNLFIVILILFVSGLTAQNQTPEVVVQMGHTGGVICIAISPDGKYIASGGYEGKVKLWELKTGCEVKTFNRFKGGISFSPDGNYLAIGFEGDTINIYDLNTGVVISSLRGGGRIAFSPDMKYLAACNYFEEPYNRREDIIIWDLENRKTFNILKGHKGQINSITYTPDSKSIVSCSYDKTIKLWDVKSGNEINTYSGNNSLIHTADVSPDGKYIAGGYYDSTIRIWEIQTGKFITLIGHRWVLDQVKFSPDGKILASTSWDNTIRLWEVQTGREVLTKYNVNIKYFCFSPDGKYIISVKGNKIVFLDVKDGEELGNKSNERFKKSDVLSTVCISNNFKFLASTSFYGAVEIWELSKGRKIHSLKGPGNNLITACFSPDSKFIASICLAGVINIWDVQTGLLLNTLPDTSAITNSVCFSPDSKFILSHCSDSTVKIKNALTGHLISTFNTHLKIESCCYSADGKFIAVISYGTLLLLDARTFQKVSTMDCKPDRVKFNSFAFSPDGKFFAGGQNNQEEQIIQLFDMQTGCLIRKFNTNAVYSICFSQDSKYIAATDDWNKDNKIRVFDIKTRNEIINIKAETYMLNSFCFAPDNEHIISGGGDGKIKLWNFRTGLEEFSFISVPEKDYVIISPDQYYICSKNGLKSIAFVIGNHAFPPEQFDLQYNRPDIILERIGLSSTELIEAYRKAYQKRLKKMKFDEGMFNKDFHMPEMKILDENVPINTTEKNLSLKIKAEDTKYLLDRINIYINDVPVYGTDGIDLRDKKTNTYKSDIEIELSNGKNKVQVSVLNDKGVESLKETFDISYEAPEVKHDLFVVAIGASDYNDSRYKLNFAAKDAKDIGDLFLNQKDKYNDVKVLKLLDKDVTRENILKAKEFLMQSKVDDEVIVFIGGHGLLTKNFDYYFATADIDFTNPQKRGVTFEEIESLLDGIPARQKILLMDTCHSGELDKEDLQIIAQNEKQVEHGEVIFRDVPGVRIGRKNENEGLGLKNTSELMQEMFVDLRRGSGAAVISSSGGLEVSFEGGGIKNGLFTYCIIEGLKTQNADLNKDGKITVSELRDYVSDKVEKLTKGTQKPTSRKENLENDFVVW